MPVKIGIVRQAPRSLALARLVPKVDHELLLLFNERAAPVLAGPGHSLQSRDIGVEPDPKYSDKRIRLAALRQLHELVSQPILPGKEADYIVTQTMAEYLAHVFHRPFDGIVFRSAQNALGTNLVLFSRGRPFDGKLSPRFGVKYVKDSLKFARIGSVRIEYEELSLVCVQGQPYLLDVDGQAKFDDWLSD